jgi:probable HAF family extracellular repeat protein
VALLLSTGACAAASAASYTLVDLGPRFPVAINDHESIAATRRDRAILFSQGQWHRLSDRQSFANAINSHDDVAGDTGATPMLWRHGKPEKPLPLPGGSTFGLGVGINDALTVVGMFEANDATIHCFQWQPHQGSTDLGFMADGDFCQPFGVNDAGQVTGEATLTVDAERTPHAFLYDQGVFHDLGILPQGDRSQGVAINNHGDVAGRASVPPFDDMHHHAAKWPAGGQIVDLDPQGDYLSSIATAINDDGEVVGTVTLDAALHQKAVRFDGRHAVLLETEVRHLGGWALEQAAGVNAQGEIVGVGRAPDGHAHGFLLRPE